MRPEIRKRLEKLRERYEEVTRLLSLPETQRDLERFRTLGKELAHLEPIVETFAHYLETSRQLEETRLLLEEERDPELRALAKEELKALTSRLEKLSGQLRLLLLPKDPNDRRNVYLEIRAGTGGAEAALFAGDLFRMYSRYAERRGWKVEIVSAHEGEQGGFKEIIARIQGEAVYSRLKFEGGTHRVQRVPETESGGRIHTSACTVAVLPEAEEIDEIQIGPEEIRIDTFRASGAGGQHVNKTESAVRITHLPTGIVVECQDERSQHQNRARAMALLKTRLLALEREKQRREQAEARRSQVGTGDRSEKIRTYNFPQNRVTDHRINLTLYRLEEVLDGDLDPIIEPLLQEQQARMLAEMEEAA